MVLGLVRAAFATGGRDGAEEVAVVEDTWRRGDDDDIDLVAVDDDGDDGTVVGHVLGARARLGDTTVLAIAPLAVAPGQQRRGVGTALMEELLRRADDAGWPAAVLLGDPAYYTRFGFESAGPHGITYPPIGDPDSPYFQVRRLAAYDRAPDLRGPVTYCWEPDPV